MADPKVSGAEGEESNTLYLPQNRVEVDGLRKVADGLPVDSGEDSQTEAVALWQEVGVFNESEEILVLVDEAHRSHPSTLHANLLWALPNCARIGFTGTPILSGAKKRTHEIFGSYIDVYTIQQSE